MSKTMLKLTAIMLVIGGIAGCSATDELEKNKDLSPEALSMMNIEPVHGKLNVYTSMARAVKYNVDIDEKNIHKIIVENEENPHKSAEKYMNAKVGGENQLYDAVRKLDFAVLFAISNLSENEPYIKNNMYTKSAQQLALNAIKTHKDALFAGKKSKEVQRLINKERKVLQNLNEKLANQGFLSEDDLELKKGVEVGLYKLENLQKYLETSLKAYEVLAKVDRKKMNLEGRHFYELEDFDKKNKLKTFQYMAINNRSEFNIMRDEGYAYSEKEVMQNATQKYPELPTLRINGYDGSDSLYIENLRKQSDAVTDNLLAETENVKRARNYELRRYRKNNAYKELGIALAAQVELDYNIIKMADKEYDLISEKNKTLRRNVRNEEKKRSAGVNEKIALLNDKIKLMEAELKMSQIEGDRAVALRRLYFHSGLNPFTVGLVTSNIDSIEKKLKVAFNKDMIEMLARADEKKKVQEKADTQWSKGDKWLERLMAVPQGKKQLKLREYEDPTFRLYRGEKYNKLKIMQLGSYRNVKNADLEWEMLIELYPFLKNYKPKVESSLVNHQRMYRLVIKSPNGGLRDMCNRLRNDKIECILR